MPIRLLSSGSNAFGQLSLSHANDVHTFSETFWSTSPTRDAKLIKISCGGNHTLALFDDGDVWGCGNGSKGQLGGLTTCTTFANMDLDIAEVGTIGQYRAVDVGCTWESSFIVLRHMRVDGAEGDRDDILLSMGSNDFGILGRDPTSSCPTSPYGRVDLTQLPYPSYALIDGRRPTIRIRQLHTGVNHIVLVLSLHDPLSRHPKNGQEVLVGWGAARHNQLGISPPKSQTYISRPTILPIHPPALGPASTRVRTVALGNQHTIVLYEDGTIQAYGSNRKSQLALPIRILSESHVHEEVACTWNGTYVHINHSPKKDQPDWSIFAGGSNTHSQLATSDPSTTSHTITFPFSPSSRRLRDFVCGSEHVLALFDVISGAEATEAGATEVWAWGWNEHGNLGLGHAQDVNEPVRIWPDGHCVRQSGRAIGVWAGCGTSWIAVEDSAAGPPPQ